MLKLNKVKETNADGTPRDSKYAWAGTFGGKSFVISKDDLGWLTQMGFLQLFGNTALLHGDPEMVERTNPATGESVGLRLNGIKHDDWQLLQERKSIALAKPAFEHAGI